jgi:hypothetical protein
MESLIIALQHRILPLLVVHSTLRKMILSTVWFWVVCQVLHFMGVGVLIGVVGFFDLRLMGWMKRISLSAAMDLMPYAIVAFLVNLVTGTIFLLGRPGVYVHARSMWAKLFFVILAGLNAIIFQFTLKDRAIRLGPGEDTSFSMKLIGATSLLSWFAVMCFGRLVPYFGTI